MSVLKQLAVWVGLALGIIAVMALLYFAAWILVPIVIGALFLRGFFGFLWWGLASNRGLRRKAAR